jgi:hypothetical protein
MGNPVSLNDTSKTRVDGKNADLGFPLHFRLRKNLDHYNHLVYGDHFHHIVTWFRINHFYDFTLEATDTVYCVCGTYRKEKWESTQFPKRRPGQVVRQIKEGADNIGTVAETVGFVLAGNIPGIAAEAGLLAAPYLYRKFLTRRHYFVVLTQDDSTWPIHRKYLEGQEQCWMAADWKNPIPPKNKTAVTFMQIFTALRNQQTP